MILILLFLLFLLTRLYNILLLPIFTDESIYIYWAKFIGEMHTNWFISLTDGKPPLLIWIIAIFLKIIPPHLYLLAGRLPSVFFGAASLLGIYKLSDLLFKNKRISALSGFVYIIFPFALFYDRMALFDSMLSAMLLWAAYYCLKTAQDFSYKNAFFWGLFLGLGYLSKGTAVIFFLLLPFCYLIFLKKVNFHKDYRKIFLALLISGAIGQLLNNLQRVSKIYFMMAQKNQQFQQPLALIIEDPFRLLIGNFAGIFSWITSYYTLWLLVFGLLSLVYGFIKHPKNFLILFILWFMPLFAFAFFARELFPRYLLFTSSYFIVVFSFGISELFNFLYHKLKLFACLIFLILIPLLSFDYYLLTDPEKAPFPRTDFNQYIGDHPSGYGLIKIYNAIDNIIKDKNITLITQGTFGLYPYAFYLKYWGNERVKINPKWPVDLSTIKNQADKKETTFLVTKEFEYLPKDFPFEIAAIGEKPGGRYPIVLSIIK